VRLVLVGLMGAGKSTVGRRLARDAGLPFVDLDEEIAALAGRSIPAVFEFEGEPAFRRFEVQATAALGADAGNLIVAAGGGWMANSAARAALPDAVTVWLRVSPAEAARRVSDGVSFRPLLTGSSAADRLEAILVERLPAYGEATYTVDTEGRTPAEVTSVVAARAGLVLPDREGNRTQTYEERR
jgi:shikimate kinase